MLAKLLAGPKQGQQVHVERNQTTSLLVDLGLLEEVRIEKPQAQPVWSIVLLSEGKAEQRYALRVDHASGRAWLEGAPAGRNFDSLVAQFGEPPAALIERYRELLKLPSLEGQLAESMYARNRLARSSR